MEETVEGGQATEDLALLLEMPSGEIQRFPVNTDEEKSRLLAVLEALPEETKQKHWDRAMAAHDASPEKKATVVQLPNGQALVMF